MKYECVNMHVFFKNPKYFVSAVSISMFSWDLFFLLFAPTPQDLCLWSTIFWHVHTLTKAKLGIWNLIMFIQTDAFIYSNCVLLKLQMLYGSSKQWQTFCINYISQSPNLCMYVDFSGMLPIPILPPIKSLLLDLWHTFSRDLLWCGDSSQLVAMICSLF